MRLASNRGKTLTVAQLARGAEGAAALEFALILPVLLILFFGIMEVAMILFINSTIQSAVLIASRYGVTVGDGTNRIDRIRKIVDEQTFGFVDMDTVTIDTLVYSSFDNVGQPEPFTDANGDGSFNVGESYTDVNGNGTWDADMGRAGLGAGGDIVVYRVRYDWGLMTPLIGNLMGNSFDLVSSVAVRNEPF